MKNTKNKQVEKVWFCRHHPTNWWHEVGCPHVDWTEKETAEMKPNDLEERLKQDLNRSYRWDKDDLIDFIQSEITQARKEVVDDIVDWEKEEITIS